MRSEDDLIPAHFSTPLLILRYYSTKLLLSHAEGRTFFNMFLLYTIQSIQTKKLMAKTSMTISFSTCPPTSYTDINTMAYYICGLVERNSNSHIDNNVAALKAPLCMQWQMFPILITSVSAISSDILWGQLLRLAAVSRNGINQCVCCHRYKMLK